MSVQIESIENNAGYREFVAWLNNQITNPTPGIYNNIVNYIVNKIQVADYYCFLSELYIDKRTYWGVLFVDEARRVLIINNQEVVYTNINEAQVETLYSMGTEGLSKFFSGSIPIFSSTGGSINGDIKLAGFKEYGDDVYYNSISVEDELLYSGRISGQEIEDQILGSYNCKIDKLPYDVIELVAKKNEFTQFPIRVATNVVEHFSYEYIGQVMYVQDTELSREAVRYLEREGLISSNL